MSIPKSLGLIASLLLSASALAQVPAVLDYRGRLTVAGLPFNGQGHFAFSILDGTGMILWSSGEFPIQGSIKVPPDAIKVLVQNGFYSVRLGDTGAGMPALDGAALRRLQNPKLRVWFNEGTRGWQQAGDDVPLAPALGAGTGAQNAGLNAPQAETILRELQELRSRLDRLSVNNAPAPAQPVIVTVPVGESPVMGRMDAPLVMVEFTDYQCGYCRQFHQSVLPDLIKNYVDTGKLRLVSRNLPLPFHTNAEPAAHAALCAHEQKKFWPMREKLFGNQTALSATEFSKVAEELSMNVASFRACVEGKTFAGHVRKDGQDAAAVGISGTPTFVLGKQTDDKVTGLMIVGVRPYAAFETEIKRMLESR